MKFTRFLVTAVSFLLMAAAPAHAEPITIAIFGSAFAATTAGAFVSALFSVAAGFAASLVQKMLIGQPKQKAVGVKQDVEFGDDLPVSTTIGYAATTGKRKFIGTWGETEKVPNAYLVDVIEIGSLPFRGATIADITLHIDDKKVTILTGAGDLHPEKGYPIKDFQSGDLIPITYGWVKFKNGTQTVADPYLVDKFEPVGPDADDDEKAADRPWTANMVGRGIPHIIMTYRFKTKFFNSFPKVVIETPILPLYNPAKDSTNGGNGPHRWEDQTTWEPSTNNAVMLYNIKRGLSYNGQWFFGGQNLAASRLPSSSWIAAIQECDRDIVIPGTKTEKQFRAGYEISGDEEPLDVIEEIRAGCAGRIAEVGGSFKIMVGAPGAAVYSFTDDDIVITESQSFDPFPGLQSTYNGIEATYPEPAQKWASKDAPSIYDADLAIADGNRRLPIGVKFTAVPFARQVQRLMRAMLKEERRFRTHEFCLPPDAWPLEPNDVVSWTSKRNGYINKRFIVLEIEGRMTMNQVVRIKELDPTDYDWSPSFEQPFNNLPSGPIIVPIQPMPQWNAEPDFISDATGAQRRPAIKVSCISDMEDVSNIWVRIRVKATGRVVLDTRDLPYESPWYWRLSGDWCLPNETYEVQACVVPITNREVSFSTWITVKVANLQFVSADILDGAIIAGKIANAAVSANSIMDAAITNLKLADQAVSTNKIALAAVTAQVLADGAVVAAKLADAAVTLTKIQDGAVIASKIADAAIERDKLAAQAVDATKFATGISPVGNISGTVVPTTKTQDVITVNGKLYRWSGSAYTAAVPTVDLTGTIVGTQISDAAITAAKFASGIRPVEVVSTLPTSGNTAGRMAYLTSDGKLYRYSGTAWVSTVDATDINGTIAEANIASLAASKITGQLTDAQIAAVAAAKVSGQLVGTQISDLAITNAKLAALAVDATKLADGSVIAAKLADAAITTAKFATGLRPIEVVTALPTTGNTEGRIVFLTTDDKLYRYNGTAFVSTLAAGDITGTLLDAQIAAVAAGKVTGQLNDTQIAAVAAAKVTGTLVSSQLADAAITAAKFATGLRPVESVTSLPTSGNVAGRVVFLTSDSKLYRYDGSSWISTVPASDIAGTIADTQIAAIAAGKVTGQLTDTQIAAVAAAKLTGTIVATQIADAAITAAKFATGLRPVEIVSVLPTSGNVEGRIVYLTTDNKMYRYTGSVWVSSVPAADITGTLADTQIAAVSAGKVTGQLTDTQIAAVGAAKVTGTLVASQIADAAITISKFGTNLKPIEIVASLPSSGNVEGRIVFLTTDDKLYRYTGSVWVATVPAGDITGTLADAQIAAVAAGKVTGQLTDSQIAGVAAAKLSGQVVATQIADLAITNAKLAALAVDATKLASNAVTNTKIADDAISTPKLQASAIIADKIAANAITASKLVLSDFTNLIPDDQMFDDSTWSGAGWSRYNVANVGGMPSRACYVYNYAPGAQGGYGSPLVGGMFPVKAGTQYRVAGYAYANEVFRPWIRLHWFGATGTDLGYSTIFTSSSGNPAQATVSGDVSVTAPTNAVTASMRVYVDRTTGPSAGGAVYAGGFSARERNGASLIVDGTIATNLLAAEAITTEKLAAGAVTADIIAANAITAAKVSAGAIEAGKLAVNSVQAGNIAASAVTAGKIAANAVTAGTVAANAITAGTIAAGAVVATNISAGAITATKLFIGDTSNIFPDPEMVDLATFTPMGDISLVPNPYNGTSTNKLNILGTNGAGDTAVFSTPFQIEENKEYWFSLRYGVEGSGSVSGARAEIQFYSDRAMNNITAIAYLPISTSTGSRDTARTVKQIAPAGTKFARMIFFRIGGGGSGDTRSAVFHTPIIRRSVDTDLIVDGSIIADKIAANAIVAEKIAANAVTADAIAANAITAAKISAGAIEAGKLAANSVQAGNIAALAVTAGKIAANAVTAGTVAANAITAGTIAAGAIVADKIAANAISAKHLILSDAENLIPNGGWEDGDFDAYWIISGTASFYPVAGYSLSGNRTANLQKPITDPSVDVSVFLKPEYYIPVAPGDVLYGETSIMTNGTAAPGGFYFRVEWFDASKTGSVSGAGDFANNVPITNTMTTWSGKVSVPTNARYARIRLYSNKNNAVASNLLIDKIVMRRANAAKLIVDGTIVTAMLQAEAITAGKIAANAVTADTIAANAITAAKISAGAVEAGKLAANSVQAGNIAALAITAGKIAANAVTAGTVAANAITAGTIAANAVSAANIIAGTISADRLAIGTGGNYVKNSDFAAGLANWGVNYSNNPSLVDVQWRTDTYAPLPGAYQIHQGNGTAGVIYDIHPLDASGTEENYAVVGGQWYELSSYYYGLRCLGVEMFIEYRDVSGATVAINSTGMLPANWSGSNPNKRLSSYRRGGFKMQAPSTAVRAHIFMRFGGVASGQSDAYLWLNRVYFGATHADADTLTDWSPSGVTLIGAGNIVTNAVTADAILANSITTAKIAANAVTANEIAANAITAVKINAGAVEAGKLAVNSVQAGNIVSGAVTTAKLDALAVTADKLAVNSVIAGKIAAGVISATELAANSVTTVKIAANAVTANEIAANAIIAGKIAADAITANNIAANAITAKQLVLTDFSNIIVNGDFSQGAAGWTTSGTTLFNPSGSVNDPGAFYVRLYFPGAVWISQQNTFSINPGEEYYVEAWAALGGGGDGKLRIQLCMLDSLGGNTTFVGIGDKTLSTSYQKFSGKVVIPSTIGTGKPAQARWWFESRDGTGGYLLLQKAWARQANNADLIVDGAITANKLTADSVTADKIATGAVTADAVAANAITAVKISAGAIIAGKLAAGSVQAGNIAANAVTAGTVAANAITAGTIAADAVTTATIAAGAVSATQIAAQAITATKLFIGDTSNVFPDPEMADPASFYGGVFSILTNPYNGNSTYMVSLASSNGAGEVPVFSQMFAIEENKEYWMSCRYGMAGSGSVSSSRVEIQFYSDRAATNITAIAYMPTVSNTGGRDTAKTVTQLAPAGTKFARMIFFRNGGGGANDSKSAVFHTAIVRRRIDTDLIVDGSVVADKVAANAITAGAIAANAVTAGTVAANAITAGTIAANAVTAATIAAGAVSTTQLAANAVTAVKIAGQTITGDKIAVRTISADTFIAATITGYEIAANTITATQIAATTITSAELASNSVIAGKIATNAVTAGTIAANAVTAGKIAANAIVATNIQAGVITGDKLQANTLGAREIAAGTITAKQLVITDFNNLVPDNQMTSTDAWVGEVAGWVVWGDHGLFESYNGMQFNTATWGTGGFTACASRSFPVKGSRSYRFTGQAYANNTYSAQIRVVWLDSSGGTAGFNDYLATGNRGAGATGVITQNITSPAGAVSAIIQLFVNRTNTTGAVYFGGVGCFERNGAELIVDGSITAEKIAANSITAGMIQSGSISTDKLTVGGVTVDKLAAQAAAYANPTADLTTWTTELTTSYNQKGTLAAVPKADNDFVLILATVRVRCTNLSTLSNAMVQVRIREYLNGTYVQDLGLQNVNFLDTVETQSIQFFDFRLSGNGNYSYGVEIKKTNSAQSFAVGRAVIIPIVLKKAG